MKKRDRDRQCVGKEKDSVRDWSAQPLVIKEAVQKALLWIRLYKEEGRVHTQ